MEMFIGKPHVYTIDVNNLELVESTVKEILSSEVTRKLNYSFLQSRSTNLIRKILECLAATSCYN